MKALLKCALIGCGFLSANATASLIVHYDFNNGTGDNVVSNDYNLVEVGNQTYRQGTYYSDGNPANYLSVQGPGSSDNWVVSLWARASDASAGYYSALFSNNAGEHEVAEDTPYRWQIDQHNGEFVFRTTTNAKEKNGQYVRETQVLGSVIENTWQHIVVQKFGNTSTRLFLDGEQIFETKKFIPGGLQNFNVGINRNRNNAFTGYIEDIKIWDFGANEGMVNGLLNSASLSNNAFNIDEFNIDTLVTTQSNSRPDPVPAPSVLSLLGLGLLGLTIRRKFGKSIENL